MIQRSDLRLLIGAFVALVIVSAIIVSRQEPPAFPLSVRNDRQYGAMALRLWLERSGYQVRETNSSASDLDDIDVLFKLSDYSWDMPSEDVSGDNLREWVEAGNTLIVAGTPFALNDFLTTFDISLGFYPNIQTQTIFISAAPTLVAPPVYETVLISPFPIETERRDVVPHLFTYDGQPVLVSFPQGAGVVWVSGSTYPFTNVGIQQADNGALIANMLASVPSGATIGFDERLFYQGPNTFNDWLFGTAPGWGIVLAVVMTMVYLFLRGRRFGAPIPLPENRLRREPVEYIQAMATLFRRTGQREAMMQHYQGQLRRRLSERYGVDPKLQGDELVKRVVYVDPSVDEAELRDLLTRLSRTNVSEHELISVAADVDGYLKKIS